MPTGRPARFIRRRIVEPVAREFPGRKNLTIGLLTKVGKTGSTLLSWRRRRPGLKESNLGRAVANRFASKSQNLVVRVSREVRLARAAVARRL